MVTSGPATLLHDLSDPGFRTALYTMLDESGYDARWAFFQAARVATGEPDEFSTAIETLVSEDRTDLAESLIWNLGLRLYQDPAVPTADFVKYLEKYDMAELHDSTGLWNSWLICRFAEADGAPDSKVAFYESSCLSNPKAVFLHARYLAITGNDPSQLERFLTAAQDQASAAGDQALIGVLDLGPRTTNSYTIENMQTILSDPVESVVRRLAYRSSNPAVAQALARRNRRQLAASAELTQAAIDDLVTEGDPDILLTLAENPATPEPVLRTFVDIRGVRKAALIRQAARETLIKIRPTRWNKQHQGNTGETLVP